MLKPFSNRSLYPILEAYMSMNEALTIPLNQEDELEKQLYSKLDKNYKYADFIVRWYRNDKKALIGDNELQRTYVYNLKNILDLLKDYDEYIAELQRSHSLKETINLPSPNGGTWKMNPIKDFASIRRLDGVKALVKYLGDLVHSSSAVKSTNSKYAITDADRSNIRLVGFSEHVAVWATRTFESTNKFIFQLWQNADTMDRGDAYGDKVSQSPYCTHAITHWNSYSEGYADYQQYWFLSKVGENGSLVGNPIPYATGDLSNPTVVNVFNNMRGSGGATIIAMNDTGDDFLDDNDRDFDRFSQLSFGKEVEMLDEALFDRIGETSLIYDSDEGKMVEDESYENDTQVYLKSDGVVKRGENDIVIVNIRIEDSKITELPKGLPEKITGDFDCSGCTMLSSLDGIPKEIGGNIILKGCESITFPVLSQAIDVKERAAKIVGEFTDVKDLGFDGNGNLTYLFPFSDLDDVVEEGRDGVSFETVTKIVDGDGFDVFSSYGEEIYWDGLDTDIFDKALGEFGLDFDDIRKIYNGDIDDVVDDGNIDQYKAEKIMEMLHNDFYNGNSMYSVYSDCEERGAEKEAYDDIMGQLMEKLPLDSAYGVQYDDRYKRTYVKVVLDENDMCTLVKNYEDSDHNPLYTLRTDEYGECDYITFYEPQYGWSGFDKEMWNEALTDFTNRVVELMNSTSPVEDAEGQQFFGFDKDYRQS